MAANWRTLDDMSGKAATGAAVKADGYGLGAAEVVETLYKAGCRDFYVAHWQEVAPLIPFLGDAKLSVLHGVSPLDVGNPYLLHPNVKPVLNSLPQVQRWLELGGSICDIMIDTGMNRLGLSMGDITAEIIRNLDIDVCMSHLASADQDSPQNGAQLADFRVAKSNIAARRYSLSNSAGIVLGADYAFDLTRPGLALYGGIPRTELNDRIRQVATPETMVLQTRDIRAGDKVGYNATFTADRDMRIAICTLGYADGYLRSFAENGRLQHQEQYIPILGRISMDLLCTNISHVTEVDESSWLTCIYDLPRLSAGTGLSQYELLTNLGTRFDRNWY